MTAFAGAVDWTATPDWSGGADVVLIDQCRHCARRWYLPHDACPACGSTDVARVRPAGTGTTVAVTIIHRRPGGGAPIGVALVDLDEGVRMMARCPTALTVGCRVRIVFVPSDEPGHTGPLPSCEEHP